jgi:TIR domain
MTEMLDVGAPIIFINYRRTDAGWPADLLESELGRGFGATRVFQDVRGIDAGDDFVTVLDSQLRRATILIVLIGSNWLRVGDKFGRRRLDQEQDWVRREIRMALQKPGCRVIPVLIDDAELPDEREALPEDISALLTRQRFSLRQAHSHDDIEALTKEIEKGGFRRVKADTSRSTDAIGKILAGCYKRSLFTRTHAQLSLDAMFDSISNCRKLVQSETPEVSDPELAQALANLLGALDGIERIHTLSKPSEPIDVDKIDQLKLQALRNLRLLSRITKIQYAIPDSRLTEDVFFSKDDADKPPTIE